jgi:arsenate reductase
MVWSARMRRSDLVLFACTNNAGRSQIANAFFNELADPAKARSIAAGLDAAPAVYEEVVCVMREAGHDLATVQPLELTGRMLTDLTFLVTLGCQERCPTIPIERRQDWHLPELRGLPLREIRRIRDDIRGRVTQLVHEKSWGRMRAVM